MSPEGALPMAKIFGVCLETKQSVIRQSTTLDRVATHLALFIFSVHPSSVESTAKGRRPGGWVGKIGYGRKTISCRKDGEPVWLRL
jgi:hypothetical protein